MKLIRLNLLAITVLAFSKTFAQKSYDWKTAESHRADIPIIM